ncbi:MAG TPA: serine/threonine protein kinase, partial [bacterium]|nr:serine/threonine protein kinase [bacterium]
MHDRFKEHVRDRLRDDLANGKTIVLSAKELEDAALRRDLPEMLERLEREHAAQIGGGPDIEGYTVLAKIGQGGMSSVYLARQDALGRYVAIKVLPTWLDSSDRARSRLVQEAHALASVRHPNIVVIHDVIDGQETLAIAMEWVDGRTLADLLSALAGSQSEEVARICDVLGASPAAREQFETSTTRVFVRMMRDIAKAAQAVHDAGLLHLDIKPSNVLVRRDGTPLLADFGVVREIASDLTHTRTFAGTPAYASPEQIRRRDHEIGPRSDVYSLGLTLYELLSRQQPLKSLDFTGIVQCVETGRMPRLSQVAAVPGDLENIVHKAMAPEPEHRYASASALAEDLDAFLAGRPVKARPLSSMQRLRRWVRNEPWQAALALALALLLPALAVLGTYLALQLPAIEQVERERQKMQVNRIKQEAVQTWLIRARNERDLRQMLSRAVALDTGNSAVVCMVAMSNQFGGNEAARLLEDYPQQVRQHRGLQLLVERRDQRRTYFDDAEVAELATSTDPIDDYLLALDRTFWANDQCHQAAYRTARAQIERALWTSPDDPLLYGLLCWVTIRAQDHAAFEDAAAAIRTRWPLDPVARAWPAVATEPLDPERCERIAREIVGFAPRNPRGYELLAGMFRRTNRPDQAGQALDEAEARGVTSPLLRGLRRMIAFEGSPETVSREAVRELQHLGATTGARLGLLMRCDREAALDEVRSILAQDQPSAANLEQSYRLGLRLTNRAISDEAFARYRELYPDLRRLFPSRFRELVMRGDDDEAAELAAMITLDTADERAFQ